MKKLFFCVAILVLLISSCTVTQAGIVFDESIPLEQTSWLSTGHLGTVVSYNGIAVKWSSTKVVQIPAGDTLLELNVSSRGGNVIIKINRALFRYSFQPEKHYSFLLGMDNDEYGVSVYAWNFGETMSTYDSKHFVEFVQFLNIGHNAEPTVLN